MTPALSPNSPRRSSYRPTTSSRATRWPSRSHTHTRPLRAHAHARAHARAHAHMRPQAHARTHPRAHAPTRARTHARTRANTCTHTPTRPHQRTHASCRRVHTYIHAKTHRRNIVCICIVLNTRDCRDRRFVKPRRRARTRAARASSCSG
eukprot:4134370-Pleurochrysis_carterae.AAC.2